MTITVDQYETNLLAAFHDQQESNDCPVCGEELRTSSVDRNEWECVQCGEFFPKEKGGY